MRSSAESSIRPAQRVGEGEERRIALSPPFQKELDACWMYELGALPEAASLQSMADFGAAQKRSTARLYEDEIALGPAHAAHAEIRNKGRGAFSHWKETLYFSTS